LDAFILDKASNERVAFAIPNITNDELARMNDEMLTDSQLLQFLDNLEMSADAKALVAELRAATLKIGETAVRIGRRILEIALVIFNAYPRTAFGAIVGFILGILIGSIPVLGALLAPIATPLLVALGVAHGYSEDLRDIAVDRKIREALNVYDPLVTAKD